MKGKMVGNLTFRDFGVDEEEVKKVRAELRFAVNLGLITDDSLQGVESRRLAKEAETTAALGENKIVYGLSSYSRQAYLRYELTRFRLDFISEDSAVNYKYTDISEKDAIDFYEKNRDLYTRANGESFAFDEVRLIVKKKIRELEYEKNVNLLCEQI
jgi:hypothetical protein